MADGAIESGSIHVGRLFNVAMMERGGWVEGVRMSFVRAMSSGASRMPATPAAETDIKREAIGEDDDKMLRPPAAEGVLVTGDDANERPGSGRARKAEKNERVKDVTVERSNE